MAWRLTAANRAATVRNLELVRHDHQDEYSTAIISTKGICRLTAGLQDWRPLKDTLRIASYQDILSAIESLDSCYDFQSLNKQRVQKYISTNAC